MTGLCLVLGVLTATAQGKGRLREFEEPLRGERDSSSSDSRSPQDQELYREYRAGDPLYPGAFAPASRDEVDFADVVFYPCLDHGLRFDEYPYAGGRRGRYFLGEEESPRDWSVDAHLYTIRVEHDLLAYGLTGTARYASGGNFRFDCVEFLEEVDGSTDRLTLQTFEVNYGPGSGPRRYQWTAGWGFAALEGQETHVGLSFQGALDWFPVRPISLRLHGAWLLFSESTMLDLQAEGNLHWNRFALGLGFRTVLNSEGDHLSGPLASLTVWF